MKTKITLKKLVPPLLSSVKYCEFKIPKYWKDNMITLVQKMKSDYSLFSSRAISTKIDLTPLKISQLIKTIHSSISQKTLQSNFYYCILLHFLTI